MKRTPLPDTSPTPIGLSLSSAKEGKPKEVAKETAETDLGHGPGALAPISVPSILLENDEPSYKLETGSGHKHGFVEKTAETQSHTTLPETYGTGRLMLTARDPRCLYAHWDLTFEQQKHYRDLSENHRLQLRVYRNVIGGPLVAEEVVHPESSHSFVVLEPSAAKYVAELGYYPQGGAWTAVTGSDSITPPLEAIPDKQPIEFATLNFARAGSFVTAAPQISFAMEANEPVAAAGPPATHVVPEFPLPRSWRSSPAPALARKYEPESLPPVLEEASSYRRSDPARLEMLQALIDAEIIDVPHWMSPAPVPGPAWTEEQKRQLEQLGGWTDFHRRQLGSQEIEELIRVGALPQELDLGAQSAQEKSISSGLLAGAPPVERRDFWFSVNAELVIYGATEPDAAVTIGGRRIQLRPDGTFSYRFSLPDGSYELPLAARSPQGDERRAELSFYRGTRYGGEVRALLRNPELKPPVVENLDSSIG